METDESTIPPFVFVEGRKYVLAETEERSKPEIFEKLTPPPRKISVGAQGAVLLNYGQDLTMVVLCFSILVTLGIIIVAFGFFAAQILMMTAALPTIPVLISAACRIYSKMKIHRESLRLMQNGSIGEGRFYGIFPTGKKVYNILEMQLKYQFTIQDGNTYYTSLFMAEQNKGKLLQLSDDSLKLVFYDPEEPSRNFLFDTLPQGIWFDDLEETFCTDSLPFLKQILFLCITATLIPAITLLVALCLC